jgi:hypothetical protein
MHNNTFGLGVLLSASLAAMLAKRSLLSGIFHVLSSPRVMPASLIAW